MTEGQAGRPWERDRDERGRWFDGVADDYHAARPGYPPALYDDLVDLGALGEGTRVLEVGPGTGQASADLAARGGHVTAVELGANLAAILRARFATTGEVEVVEGDALALDLPVSGYDLIASGTAWHWLAPDRAVSWAHERLAPGGWLAVWWHVFGDDGERDDPFGDAVGPLLDRLFPSRGTSSGSFALDTEARVAELTAGGRFGHVTERRYRWVGRHGATELRRLWATWSTDHVLPPAEHRRVLDAVEQLARDDFGGVVERPYVTVLYAAPRLDPAEVAEVRVGG